MRNDGKKLESKTSAVFKEFTAKRRGYYHRFVDKTQAMSGFVPKAPGDYILLVPGKAILVECKSTVKGSSLVTLAHKNKTQIAEHRKFHRAKHHSIYIYWNLTEDVLEIHDGHKVVDKINDPLITCKGKEFPESLTAVIGLLE